MGSCHRAPSWCQAPQREDFPPLPHRAEGTWWVPKREFGKQMHLPTQISDQSPCVLCQEERRLSMPSAGLPEVEWGHDKELLSTSIGLWHAHQAAWCRMVHYPGPLLGLQQCLTQGRSWVEGSLLHELGTLQAAHHVLWIMQLACYLPDDDEWHPLPLHWL